MSVTPEELGAFADNELEEPRRSAVVAEVAADPALAADVERHRALKNRLMAHFAPILDEPIPERLGALLGNAGPKVADLATARQRRTARNIPRWGWVVGPAFAASVALAVLLPHATPEGNATPELAKALDGQLVATQASDAPTRVLLSFRKAGGQYCRAFSGEALSGIACKDRAGWQLETSGPGGGAQRGDYRMAGSSSAAIMARAQEMAAGPALSAKEEQAAMARGWR
jgi:hypothetical protein